MRLIGAILAGTLAGLAWVLLTRFLAGPDLIVWLGAAACFWLAFESIQLRRGREHK